MKSHESKSFILLAALICSVSLLLSGAHPLYAAEAKKTTPQLKPQYGGILKIAENQDGASIGYPPKLFPVVSMRQTCPVLEPLFRIDGTGRPKPWLATGFKENIAEKSVTLTIRKGVKFHDGTDFNGEAVKWNLELAKAAQAADTGNIKSVDLIDPFTVRINLVEWNNIVVSNLAMPLGFMISPTAFNKNGEEWAARNPVGTGPFQFVSWEKDVKTVYKKFDNYWQKGKPYLDGIEWSIMSDPLTRVLSFKNREVDAALSIAAKDMSGLEKEGYVVTRRPPPAGTLCVVPDAANPNSPFAKLKVRQATQHAIDTNSIAKNVFYGEAEPVNQWIYKGHWAYNPALKGYPYNPAKAKQLLKEAGYPNGFKTKISYLMSSGADNDKLMTAVQGYLQAVGIEAQLEPMQRGLWNQVALQGGKWEGLIWAGVSSNPDIAAWLASRFAGGKPYSQMLLPDDYLAAVKNAVTVPASKKVEATKEAMRLLTEKHVQLIIFSTMPDAAVSKTSVHNHGLYGNPNTGFWTPEDAWIEKNK
jgi:peptide/nickel transport system substrate-binding protein